MKGDQDRNPRRPSIPTQTIVSLSTWTRFKSPVAASPHSGARWIRGWLARAFRMDKPAAPCLRRIMLPMQSGELTKSRGACQLIPARRRTYASRRGWTPEARHLTKASGLGLNGFLPRWEVREQASPLLKETEDDQERRSDRQTFPTATPMVRPGSRAADRSTNSDQAMRLLNHAFHGMLLVDPGRPKT